MPQLTYDDKQFYLDGQPFTLLSGAMHYFRIHPDQWRDRLVKLKECGFNTIETYTCWNLHEKRPGEFDFSGILDLPRYIRLAQEVGLYVILRPGPYICAEWEFGGLPAWLLARDNPPLRCNDPVYLSQVKPYYAQLFARISPYLCTKGGNILMVQVENEYGSYGDDTGYLQEIVKIYRENGVDCTLFTSDGTCQWMLSGGTVPGILSVANFGSHARENFANLRAFRPHQPLMCGEFWSGWFDHWYEEHHVRSVEEMMDNTRELLRCGASMNYYMFCGGTNFGFLNGANHTDTAYQPTVTSYDYCAPLSEAGDRTPAYWALRQLLQEEAGVSPPPVTATDSPKKAYGRFSPSQEAPLFDNLDALAPAIHRAAPATMEELGQSFGYILYRTTLKGPFESLPLVLEELHDRAHIFLDRKLLGIWERSRPRQEIRLSLEAGEEKQLDILVENMGRVNYGPRLLDRKGLVGGVRLGQRKHFGWEMRCLEMEDLSRLGWKEKAQGPKFLRYRLAVEEPGDTFLVLPGFTKGFCVLNGWNLGRYYNAAGPQKSLYVPGPLLRKGENELIVFESDAVTDATVVFTDRPSLG